MTTEELRRLCIGIKGYVDSVIATGGAGLGVLSFTYEDSTLSLLSNGVSVASIPLTISSENGLSAYELAVLNGFEGTVTEWLNSLNFGLSKIPDGGLTREKLSTDIIEDLNYRYTLPEASDIVTGGVKLDGTTLIVANGVTSLATSLINKIEGNGTREEVSTSDIITKELSANVFYKIDATTATSVILTLGGGNTNVLKIYAGTITIGAVPPVMQPIAGVEWNADFVGFEANKVYQFSITEGLGTILGR